MIELESKHPEIWQKFNEGYFVVQKSSHVFSTIALDQAHEQVNAVIKDEAHWAH